MNLLPISRASKASLESRQKGVLLPLPLPPVSPAPPAPKSTKTARKRPRSESDELPAMDNTARDKSSHTDPLLSKHRKEERNHADLSEGIKVGVRYNWRGVSCGTWALCDSL